MRNHAAKNVDEYIANAAEEARPKQIELRSVIKSIVPKAEEGISWGVPFYRQNGLLAGYSVFKNHVTFGLVAVLDVEMCQKLEAKGYKTGKKTIQIKFDQKIPVTEIKRMLVAQVKDNQMSA